VNAAPASVTTTRDPAGDVLRRHYQFSDFRCHASPAFLAAQEPGATPVWFGQEQDGELVASAVALERRGRLTAKLTFPTTPVVTPATAAADAPIWAAVRAYGRARRIGTVAVHSFEAPERIIPPLGAPRLTERVEYVVDLEPPPERLLAACSENHRRNIRKAEKQGVVVRMVTAPDAATEHVTLFRQSMERRAARGEDVAVAADEARVRRLAAAGAGRFVRAEREGRPLASLFILVSPRRAYYHSGGSAPDGMKVGASHIAMWRAMAACRAEGVRWFNLAGASAHDAPGLAAFKLGFGPRAIGLAHALYEMDLPFPWSLARRVSGR
jgi:hypothetical protein